MIDRISRRSMLTGAVAAGAASLASSVVSAAPATKWDETVDVIVIGSGFAGLAAAIEAKKAGANVVVLEKMPTAGGNSIINGGILTATGCPQQKKAGIEDSFDLLEKDILVAGNYMNDKAKVHLLAQSALSNFEWTVNELGVEYLPDAIGQEGGHSVPRYVTTKNGSGSGIVQKELDKCKELGIPVRLRCYVQNIIRTEKGVEGVRVREGYRFPNEGSGKEKTIRATKGVVLCYGGFSADVKFRMFQDPKLDGSLDTTNQPGATSELWRETMAIGCLQVQDDWIQCGPWTSPREKGMGIGWQFSQTAAAEYGLWVNSDGKRFVNELANRKVRADAIVAMGHPAVIYTTLKNAETAIIGKNMTKELYDRAVKNGVIKVYPDLKAMADDLKIPFDALKKTNDTFNGYIKDQKDPDFNCMMFKNAVPNVEGPFLAVRLWPRVHHTMGGLEINDQAQVLDVRGNPIQCLYAAGEVTGGVHGMVRLGTVAVADCMIFGRIAARTANACKGCGK